MCLQEPESTEEGEQSLQIRAFIAGLEEAVDAELDVLVVYLKCYTHLFIGDGQEGEVIPTFHISKTIDLDFASNLIPTM